MCEGRPRISLEDRLAVIAKTFAQAYFGHAPTSAAIWGELERYCEAFVAGDAIPRSQALQRQLCGVLDNHALNAFPVSRKQRCAAVEWTARLLERHRLEIGARLRDLMNELDGDEDEPEYIFKTFHRGGDESVTILEENRSIIGHGTTGLTSWQGAYFMADWAQNHADMLTGKRVIELGSGTGMLGISLLKAQLGMRAYTLTDCHHKVINALLCNLKINFAAPERDEVCLQKCCERGPPEEYSQSTVMGANFTKVIDETRVGVKHLDWVVFEGAKFLQEKANVIIGTDIVYERTLLPALSSVLRSLLLIGGEGDESGDGAIALIACTERSFTTLECFHRTLLECGLAFEIIHRASYSPTETILVSDVQHQASRLYKIWIDDGVS